MKKFSRKGKEKKRSKEVVLPTGLNLKEKVRRKLWLKSGSKKSIYLPLVDIIYKKKKKVEKLFRK